MVRITVSWSSDPETHKSKQIQKVLGYYAKRDEAIKALADYNHAPFDLDNRKVTFADVYSKVTFPEASAKNYKAAYRYLKDIADMPLVTIKAAHMQECIDGCHTTQQNMIKTVCRKVFEYALRNEITDRNPAQYLTAITKKAEIDRKMFTHDEVEELWELSEYWWAKVTLMLLYSGMRTKELRCVPIENIRPDLRWLDLAAAKNEASVRGMPLHERTVPLFCDYIENGGNLYGWSHGYLNKYLMDFHGHRAHDCRHTFATRMREIGTDELVIKRLLGHTPSDITQRIYTHLTREELTAAIDQLAY